MRRRQREDPAAEDRSASLLRQSLDDAAAFEAFYVTYAARVLKYFARRTLDGELAIDLTAETFAHALERRRQFRGHTGAEEQGWLFAIARHELAGYWRHGRVERAAVHRIGLQLEVPTDDALAEVERLADLPRLRRTVAAAIAQLPPDQARAVRERVLHERGYPEIAADLGVSEQVVRARVSRGLRALGEHLGELRMEEVA